VLLVSAVGCSDLVPPSDAWLKRSDNVATVGCYMTRQTWILTCDHNGRWTGTFGNCTQRTIMLTISNGRLLAVECSETRHLLSEYLSVCLSVCHTRESRLKGSRYRGISSLLRLHCVILRLEIHLEWVS